MLTGCKSRQDATGTSSSASIMPVVVDVTDFACAPASSSSTTSSDAPSAKCRLVENIVKSSARLVDADEVKMRCEISSYLSCPVTASEADDDLVFWKSRASFYLTLQRLARHCLTPSASSVPVESMFLTAGLTLNSKRRSMAPCKLNYCTFMHDNAGP